ncbi:MAG: oligosaccharide flippase family protein [Edaphobacter sp.]
MKRHVTNAMYGALDYASYPLGMLIAAPIILRRLGAAEYGLWMVSTAIVSAGGIIASGFSDAGIQRTARLHGANEAGTMLDTIRSMFAINLALGFVIALLAWIAAPYAASHIAVSRAIPMQECLVCLRIASVLILVRATETVSVATQRAFQQYRGTVQISTAVRILTLSCAIVLALLGKRTESIMAATAVFLATGTCLQFWHLRTFLGTVSLWPAFHPQETHTLLSSGVFVWLQAVGSVVFRQFDRILLGISLGAMAVAPYSVCIQVAEPLFGLTASGLSFFFPYLSGRASTLSRAELQRSVLKVLGCNLLLVLGGTTLLLVFGNHFLRLWVGAAVAHNAAPIFPLIVIGSALSGFSVTGTYAAQALGLFRMVAFISLGSRCSLLLLMFYLLHHLGLQGLAIARVCYGAASLLVYLPLIRQFGFSRKTGSSIAPMPLAEFQEGAQP